ncbi:MAG TPA: hypothetical protein VEK77_14830 [Gemmatimonadales bacterium]|nr:hypothetical protein [Gemmatimonadales bacterium]
MTCKACGSVLSDTYYVVNGHIVCEKCRRSVETDWNRGGSAGRFGKALALGVLAMIACSIVWYLVLKATDSQWGILAVVVGLVIGGAVRKGSNGRGGWRYQTLAIFLTYTAIVSSYVPFIIQEVRAHNAQVTKATPPTDKTLPAKTLPVVDSTTTASTSTGSTTASKIGPLGFVIGIVVLLAVLYATPFLAGIQNLIGVLIIGFALYEAWKLNRRAELKVSGPHRVSMTGAPA